MPDYANTKMPLPDGKVIEVRRYPFREQELHQAWDNADLMLLKWFEESCDTKPSGVLVVNDSFGGLALGLGGAYTHSWGDSYVGLRSLEENTLHSLGKGYEGVFIPAHMPPPEGFGVVLIKLPKNHDLFLSQLSQLREMLPTNAVVMAGIMAKDLNRTVVSRVESLGFEVSVSLAWKKARLLTMAKTNDLKDNSTRTHMRQFHLHDPQLVVKGHPGVFSINKADEGGVLLTKEVPQGERGVMVDLGCGNGMVGAAMAFHNPEAKVILVDESYLAVDSARQTFAANQLEGDFHFRVTDCLSAVTEKADWVFCNPPFHAGRTLDYSTSLRMFSQAKNILKPTGQLVVVGNRHLNYHIHLKKIFPKAQSGSKHAKFVVFRCQL